MKKMFRLTVACAMLLAGCGQNGSQFLGTWANTKNKKSTMTIERNGDAFIVRRHNWDFIGYKDDSFPATLQDDMLHMNVGIGVIDFAIDKSTQHLVGGGVDYIKEGVK
ncbi:hypothetical protein WBP06_25125 [Novosphingobium sp. BL-8H]|uniref:LptM family lipoprotein n=1 Tax=Novosphingobium sp. BL-8H TaxID=3127640 RepID=UPI0037573351